MPEAAAPLRLEAQTSSRQSFTRPRVRDELGSQFPQVHHPSSGNQTSVSWFPAFSCEVGGKDLRWLLIVRQRAGVTLEILGKECTLGKPRVSIVTVGTPQTCLL